jgi:hypothetical protein
MPEKEISVKEETIVKPIPSNNIETSSSTTPSYQIHNPKKNISFSISDIPRRSEKGITISYKLKEHEIEPVENLMMLLETQVTAVALKYIIIRVFEDYGNLIREEAEWRQKILTLDVDEINKLINTKMRVP